MTRRLPAEWEHQDGVLIAWPHAKSDWAPVLERVEPVFLELASAISHCEKVLIAIPEREGLEEKLVSTGADLDNTFFFYVESNDTWARDFGPITVYEESTPRMLDFGFNGWGLKFTACYDNQITRKLHRAGAFGTTSLETVGLILEGGSIESDGEGTLLTTAECLLQANRNPHLSQDEIEHRLYKIFGAQRVLWLKNGYLAGDDTDSHIDTLARFAPGDAILHTICDTSGDEHFDSLAAMTEELKEFRTAEGRPYMLFALPLPGAVYDDEGQRLPATYANFLIMNGVVLVPTYNDEKDGEALHIIGAAFPGRSIIGIHCTPLLLQHGSLHCVTMQLPEGVLQ